MYSTFFQFVFQILTLMIIKFQSSEKNKTKKEKVDYESFRSSHFSQSVDEKYLIYKSEKLNLLDTKCLYFHNENSTIDFNLNSQVELKNPYFDRIKTNFSKCNSEISQSCPKVKKLSLTQGLLSIFSNYVDVVYSRESVQENLEQCRLAYCTHILNHLSDAHFEVKHNTGSPPKRDQGFNKARAMIVCPFKDSCLRIVNFLIKLYSLGENEKFIVDNKSKFVEEYSQPNNELDFNDQMSGILKNS